MLTTALMASPSIYTPPLQPVLFTTLKSSKPLSLSHSLFCVWDYQNIMDGKPSSSKPSMMLPINQAFPCGMDTELLRIESAALSLMTHDENQAADVIRTGEFAVRVVTQKISPVLITLCMVGELHWPITKDYPIIRVGLQSFAFAMPGLLYGLQFPENCCEEILNTLARVFMKFAQFQDHSGRKTGTEFSVPEIHPRFWFISHPKIERITEPQLKRIGAGQGKSTAGTHGMNEGLLKVIRMSGVAKLISKAILVGGLDADHIEIFDMRLRPEAGKRAFPTIFAFTDIVEAVEATGVIVNGNIRSLPHCHPTWTPLQGVKIWNINKRGLMLLLHTLVASASIYNDEVADVAEKTAEIRRIKSEPMEEDSRRGDPMEEEGRSNELMEEECVGGEEEEGEEATTIREIRFPIIVGPGITGHGGEKPGEEVEDACVCMEVV